MHRLQIHHSNGNFWYWISFCSNVCAWVGFSLAYHCLKWAGKPRILSPLMCARYGWINIGCDMLKCSSCQAFLCASLQPTLDFEKCKQNTVHQKRTVSELEHRFILCCRPAKNGSSVSSLPFFFIFNRWNPHFRDIQTASDTTWEVLSLAWLSMSR